MERFKDIRVIINRFKEEYDLTDQELAILTGLSEERLRLLMEYWMDLNERDEKSTLAALQNFAELMAEVDNDLNLN